MMHMYRNNDNPNSSKNYKFYSPDTSAYIEANEVSIQLEGCYTDWMPGMRCLSVG